MITHLISTTEFVKLMTNDLTNYDWSGFMERPSIALSEIINYTNFVSQKPELWMFVPCDEEGNVLEEPKLPYEKATWCDKCEELNPEYSKWYKAQSKVLFSLEFEKIFVSLQTIEELINYCNNKNIKIYVTETALNQIL